MIRKNIIGIDINDISIKIIQLDESKSVVAYGNFKLPEGIVKEGVIVDCEAFSKKCRHFLKQTNPVPIHGDFVKPHAIVSLPGDKVWTHTLVLPNNLPKEEYETYILEEASKIIPVDLARLYTTHIVSTVRDRIFATFAGAEKAVVDRYQTCLLQADIDVDFIGSTLHSIARAVLPDSFASDNYIIVDIGNRRTTIGVFDENTIAYAITQTLVTSEAVNEAASSELEAQDNKILDSIVKDIQHMQINFAENTDQAVTKIILTGHLARDTSIISYIHNKLGLTVSLGDSYRCVQNTKIFDGSVTPASFANVVGLALYGVDRNLQHMNLLPLEKNKIKHWYSIYEYAFRACVWKKVTHYYLLLQKYIQNRLKYKTKLIAVSISLAMAIVFLVYVMKRYFS